MVAPSGTVALIDVAVITAEWGSAATDPKSIAVAPAKLVPLIRTSVPGAPPDGVKLVILGMTEKSVAEVVIPWGVMILIFPVVAPSGTVALIVVAETIVNRVATLLNFTSVAPWKPLPVIVTWLPTGPLEGKTMKILGGAVTVCVPARLVEVTEPTSAVAATSATSIKASRAESLLIRSTL